MNMLHLLLPFFPVEGRHWKSKTGKNQIPKCKRDFSSVWFRDMDRYIVRLTGRLVTMNFLKLNIWTFLVLIAPGLTHTTEGENVVDSNYGVKEDSKQNLYTVIAQPYYVPVDYKLKYVPQSGNQIPVSVVPTPKTLLSPGYKVAYDTSKYGVSSTTKQPESYSNEGNYRYVYALANVVPSTTPAYPFIAKTGNDYYEKVPKQYHYGYRVSSPHSGAEFGHSEVNDGYTARGYYHVLLPDGRLQNVKYWAGPSGYHATIVYEKKY